MEQVNQKQSLYDLSVRQLHSLVKESNQPDFRAVQILNWIYKKQVHAISELKNVPEPFRQILENNFSLVRLPLKSCLVSKKNDAIKFGFSIDSGHTIESVIIKDLQRRTLCVSSQVGCALGCSFCETGRMGFVRNLKAGEIIGQLLYANEYLESQSDVRISHIVFMGMGEALLNFNTFVQVVEILMHKDCFGFNGQRITVSTAGVVPAIEKLTALNLPVSLAISLNGFSNESRKLLMPITDTYPIESVIAAAKQFSQARDTPVTFEYVVIAGENDTRQAAFALVKLLHGFKSKVNLIPLNTNRNQELVAPSAKQLAEFGKLLRDKGVRVTIRQSKGQDISGACGQLSSQSVQ